MARIETSNVVEDIIDAFRQGLRIFKKSKKLKKQAPADVSEEHVKQSLTHRPQDIRAKYEQHAEKHGQHFRVGDGTSQNSLAHILLVLNTGLIRLLGQALSRSSKDQNASSQELLSLSERTAKDTLSALSELSIRLTNASRSDLGMQMCMKHRNNVENSKADLNKKTMSERPFVRPNVNNGAWVRSKSEPSVLGYIPAKKPGVKRPEYKRRASDKSSLVGNAKHGSGTSTSSSNTLIESQSVPLVDEFETFDKISSRTKPKKTLPEVKYSPSRTQVLAKDSSDTSYMQPERPIEQTQKEQSLKRHPSMLIVPADLFDLLHQPARYQPQHLSDCVPPHCDHTYEYQPQKQAQHRSSSPKQTRHELPASGPDLIEAQWAPHSLSRAHKPRPPSMMTCMTTGTKIGEIPEDKLPDRLLSTEQVRNLPLPYVVPAMLDPPQTRRRRGLKFWKKDRGCEHSLAAM